LLLFVLAQRGITFLIPNRRLTSRVLQPLSALTGHAAAIAKHFDDQLSQSFKDKRANALCRVGPEPETPDEWELMEKFVERLFYDQGEPALGDLLTGQVAAKEWRGIYLDLDDLGITALLPWDEISLIPKEENELREQFLRGQTITAKVIGVHNEFPVVSLRILEFRDAWKATIDAAARGDVLEANITEVSRMGTMCVCNGLRAFIPVSQYGSAVKNIAPGHTVKVRLN
jgi:hypothetical protein